MLRLLDSKKIIGIAVQKIPKKGLGIAINDRLYKAAKKKMKDKLNILKNNLNNKIWYEKKYQIDPYLSEERGKYIGASKLLLKPRTLKKFQNFRYL